MSIDINKNLEPKWNGARLKAENVKNLSKFWSYWINSESLQKVMLKLWQNLWDFWSEGNWVDWDLWKNSIKCIWNIQRKLNLPVTWVVNFTLLTLLFPKTFRTFNKQKNWRSIEETINYVKEKVTWEKLQIKVTSVNDRLSLLWDINKTKTKRLSQKIIKNSVEENNDKWIWKVIYSEPAEKKGKMTYCSRTACKNLYKFWLSYKDVPRWSSAIASMKLYWNKKNYVNNISSLPEWTNVLDLFIDSRSKYEHRAAAYLNNWEWYVLDPYSSLPSNKWNRKNPIPLNEYIGFKKIMWAFPHTV